MAATNTAAAARIIGRRPAAAGIQEYLVVHEVSQPLRALPERSPRCVRSLTSHRATTSRTPSGSAKTAGRSRTSSGKRTTSVATLVTRSIKRSLQ